MPTLENEISVTILSLPALLTSKQACTFLQVSRVTLCKWVREARFPVLRLPDGQYRFRLEDLTPRY
jgi:excisionase family DNA binding protein